MTFKQIQLNSASGFDVILSAIKRHLQRSNPFSFLLLLCATCLLPNLMEATAVASGSSNNTGQTCEAQVALIRITKEEYDPVNQALMRVCEGEIRVNKCEGKCQSSLQPSFNSPTGFLKKCICCKENKLRQSEFILNDCFDVNGNKLFGSMVSMLVTMQEPASCSCIQC